eukprot:TRINITY_DN41262_c0_g1_i2.p1 TRINITY_DN41262_c0_g1~~TRINITY_DN41262_c0_g1_i2.p1  ORF type:complete len:445 (+),score=71.98 TRINITY_DN41262_c0_g1_i2:125-1459(+)
MPDVHRARRGPVCWWSKYFVLISLVATAKRTGGPHCPYESVGCQLPRVRRFLEVWAQKRRCWLCENITLASVTEGVPLLKEALTLDIPVTEGMGLTQPWLEMCLPAYLLAMVATTRGKVLQPWRLYEFGMKVLWTCRYEDNEFFRRYGVTPTQIAYTFGLIGHRYINDTEFASLQHSEYAPEDSGQLDSVWAKPLVIDVGMGLGADTRYYLSQGFRVVGVEANPQAVQGAIADPATSTFMQTGQLNIVNAAIVSPDSNDTAIKFFILPKRPEQSKALEWITQDGGQEVSVRTTRCADLINVFGQAVYMKVDIEFNTVDCLESLWHEWRTRRQASGEPLWRPPKFLSLELEASHLKGMFYDMLVDLGYSSYKVTRQFLFSPGPCEVPAYDSEVPGCGSGPFGEAAVDYLAGARWRDMAEFPADNGFIEEFDKGYDWFDLHFRLAA